MKKNNALRTAAVLLIIAIVTACFACELLTANAGIELGFWPFPIELTMHHMTNLFGGILWR